MDYVVKQVAKAREIFSGIAAAVKAKTVRLWYMSKGRRGKVKIMVPLLDSQKELGLILHP